MKATGTLSVAQKLRVMILLISGIALLIASLSYVLIEVISFRQSLIERISVLSDFTTTNATAALTFDDPVTASKLLNSLKAETAVTAATLYTTELKEFASFARNEAAQELILIGDKQWRHTAAQSGNKEYRLTWEFLDMLSPVYLDGELIGYLQIESSTTPLYNMLKTLLMSIVLVWIVIMVGVYFLGARLQRRISAPIEELVDGLQDVTEKQDYSIRLPVGNFDEIGKIVQKFNEMLKQIQLRDERLSRNSQQLEQTVEERTRELQLSMQDAINSKELAEQANRAKSDFLAIMSHEIRTPMNGVLGMSEMLLATELTLKQQKYADIIQNSGELLLKLINEILDFSKIEAGQLELECSSFNISTIVKDVIAVQRKKAQAKGLKLLTTLSVEQSLDVQGDQVRLQQVILNLLDNAIKFTEQGEVSLVVEIKKSTGDVLLIEFKVIDTGIGISPDVQQKVFDVFCQADSSTTRQYGGTGLGLSICKQLVDLMGGTLTIESIVGQGSTFSFTLPMQRSVIKVINEGQENAEQGYGSFNARILLVEDNLINQEVARDMLKLFGCEVDAAENGVQALEKLQQTEYALVFMDCQMPVKDGYETTHEIRLQEKSNKQHIPIVALTANALAKDREKCLAAGMDDFISKPFNMQDLYSVLEKWLPVDNL